MGYWLKADGTLEFPEEDQVEAFFKDDPNRKELFQSLAATPNGRFFAARMTLLDSLSSHKGQERVVLNSEGANLASLIGKPVHFTPDFTAHFGEAEEGKVINTFGVTLGGRVHPRGMDGSIALDTFGVLWDDDYPEAVDHCVEKMAEMGMSWEIVAPKDAVGKFRPIPDGPEVLYIKEYSFGGTAMLRRDHAAYPESFLFVAGAKGQDTKLDLNDIPEVKVSLQASGTSKKKSYIFNPGTPAHKKLTPPGPRPSRKENAMAFCSDCQSQLDEAIRKGDLITSEDLKSRKAFEDIEGEKNVALTAAADAKKSAEQAEKALKEAKAESEQKDLRVAAQTDAIADWEKAKDGFVPEARDAFLAARLKIHLKESAESVAEGYEAMEALKADEKMLASKGSKEPFDAFNPTVRRVAGSTLSEEEEEEEVQRYSAEHMKRNWDPKKLRAMTHGRAGFKPSERQRQKA